MKNIRKFVSWILSTIVVVMSPYIVRGVVIYNERFTGSLYLVGFGAILILLCVITISDIVEHYNIF